MHKIIFGLLWAALGFLLKWILDNALYDWFVHYLEDRWGIKEAALIASISSYVVPLLLAGAIVVLVYHLALFQRSRTPLRFEWAPGEQPKNHPAWGVARLRAQSLR
jgi:hypothetical protein